MRDQLLAACRGLRHRRGVAATVVLTLTLGIGANSAIFSAVDAVLLEPLPYPDADRLVALFEQNLGHKGATQLLAPVRIEEWNRANRSFSGLAGSYFENMTETSGALPERVEAIRTSPRFFTVLGESAQLDRTLIAAEEVLGGPPVVVISDGFWRSRFNADPGIVGRALVLSGVSRTIVGVMPASFRYPSATTEAWVPAQMPSVLLRARQARFFTAIGRLERGDPLIYWCGYSGYWPDPHFLVRMQPGRQASLATIRAALLAIEPARAVYAVRTLSDALSDSTSQQWLNTLLLALFAVTALALAAMGLYGVLSQLVAARRREIGVRMALGARAGQILGSVVAQAATVTGAGIVAGLAGAFALARFMTTLVFGIAPVDPLTFAIVPAMLAAVALAAALIPARRAAAVDPMRALRED